jgi:hypothetical protein
MKRTSSVPTDARHLRRFQPMSGLSAVSFLQGSGAAEDSCPSPRAGRGVRSLTACAAESRVSVFRPSRSARLSKAETCRGLDYSAGVSTASQCVCFCPLSQSPQPTPAQRRGVGIRLAGATKVVRAQPAGCGSRGERRAGTAGVRGCVDSRRRASRMTP